jgi:hypothetical protein
MRGRRTGRGKHGSKSYSGVTVVLLLVLVAAFIYAFKSLGIYDILVGPAANDGTGAPTATRTVATATTPSASASATTAVTAVSGTKISEEIKMNSVTLYGVQLGVFSQLENAQATSDKFRKEGSAGYLLKEETLYRVIDSVYYGESDAKTVRDQFRKGTSPDACVVRIQASGINWKVTATREQIDAIRSALSAFQGQIVALINTQKSLQQKSTSVDYIAAVKAVSDKLKEAEATLKKQVGETNSDMINNLDACLKESADGLDKLAQTDASDTKALETGLKYNIIDILLNIQNKIMG